jgi:hypothetical protein
MLLGITVPKGQPRAVGDQLEGEMGTQKENGNAKQTITGSDHNLITT